MNKTDKKKWEEGLEQDIKDYIELDLTHADKAKSLAIVTKEIKILSEEDSAVLVDKLKIEKHNFEIERGREQMTREREEKAIQYSIDNAKLKIDRSKVKLDRDKFEHAKLLEEGKLKIEEAKIALEYAKLEVEKNGKILESKKDKRTSFINILMKTLEIGVPLAVNAALVMMNFRLIYADDGRSPSELKDLMKNVYRK